MFDITAQNRKAIPNATPHPDPLFRVLEYQNPADCCVASMDNIVLDLVFSP